MKLCYLNEGKPNGFTFQRPGVDFNEIFSRKIIEINPPDMEVPGWDIVFEGRIFLYSDGQMTIVVEEEEGDVQEAEKKQRKVVKISGRTEDQE